MKRNILPVIPLVLCLAGCSTLAPKYSRPESPVPDRWPAGPAYQGTAGGQIGPAVADIGWRDFYVDEELQKVIELALANNRDLRIAALNIEKARALYRIQRAQLFPVVNAAADGYKQRLPADVSGTGQALTAEQYGVGLALTSWELDFFGRIRSLKDVALQQYLATEQARRSAQISLVAEVAAVYMVLGVDREYLKLAQDTFVSQKATYDLIRHRVDNGISSELDASEARTRMETARGDVAKYTGRAALSENALNLLVGSTVPSGLLPDALASVKMRRDIAAGLPSEVLLRRPDILQAENQLQAANANIGAARAAFFPRIALTGEYGTLSADLSGLFKAGSGTWLFAPQIVLPIFDAGSRRAGLKAAQADRSISLAQYEKAIQSAFREVSDALAERSALAGQLAAQESLVQASAEVFRLATVRYTYGIDGYLNVLDAQRSHYTAQQGLLAIQLARSANLVAFYKALGGGGDQVPGLSTQTKQ